MTETITGGCLCGAVRFIYDGEVGSATYCHCADCRRVTGGAYVLSVRLAADRFDVEGDTQSHTKAGDSGRAITRHFCPQCGTPLFTISADGATAFVKAGIFDDPNVVKPAREIWTA